jgi:thiamine biosynthesis lipoprotein
MMLQPIKTLLLLFFSSILAWANQDSVRYEVYASKFLLGTLIEGKVVVSDISLGKKALYKAFKEIERIDSLYSLQNPNSLLNYVNSNAYKESIPLDSDSFKLFERAVGYSKKYEGLFDITIGKLTELWGFNSDREIKIPDSTTIKEYMEFVNYRYIELDNKNRTIKFKKEGMLLDLGGIAKGYAVDRAVEIVQSFGIKDFLIDAGGDIFVSGSNSQGQDWNVGIKHPRKPSDYIASFRATGIGIATSGDYERFAMIKGKRYHHILDPRNGFPGDKAQSVTVLLPNVEEATVLAKYIFLVGVDLFYKHKLANDVPYLVVDSNGMIHYNDLFKERYGVKAYEP